MDRDKVEEQFFVEAKGGENNRTQARIKSKGENQTAAFSYNGTLYDGYISDLNHDCFAFVTAESGVENIPPLTELEVTLNLLEHPYKVTGLLFVAPRKQWNAKNTLVINYGEGDGAVALHSFIDACAGVLTLG